MTIEEQIKIKLKNYKFKKTIVWSDIRRYAAAEQLLDVEESCKELRQVTAAIVELEKIL